MSARQDMPALRAELAARPAPNYWCGKPSTPEHTSRVALFAGMWNGHSDDEANRRIDNFHAAVLNTAADAIVADCPDHSDADRCWTYCHCVVAVELRKAAKAITETRAHIARQDGAR